MAYERINTKAFLLLVMALAWLHTATAAAPAVRVDILPEVELDKEWILLADVAVIQAGGALKERLGQIRLTAAPRPGMEKRMSGPWIAAKVQHYDENLPAIDFENVPEVVRVKSASQTVSEEHLKSLFLSHVAAKIGDPAFQVSRFKVRGGKELPPGQLSVKLEDNGIMRWAGQVSLIALISVDGQEACRMSLSAWIDRFRKVVCAGRNIMKDEIVQPEDLVLTSINMSKAPDDVILDMANAVGKTARSHIGVNECLRFGDLEVPPLVNKGDRVRLVAVTGMLQVTTLGKALEQGAMGDQIRVENLSSEKVVIGRITNEQTVEVVF